MSASARALHRRSNGLPAFVALLGGLVALTPGVLSGCGTSTNPEAPPTTAPDASTSGDGSITLTTAITGGGGGGSSSSGAGRNPFGDLPDSGSSGAGSSSGGENDSGSETDGESADGESATDGNADDTGASDSGADTGPDPNACVAYAAPLCGTTPCDLRSNTCCISLTLQTSCIAGASAKCPSNEAAIHCLQACECGGGLSCCGVDNTLVGIVQTQCQSVPNGGLCSPHPQTTAQASAQLCKLSSECKNGQACIAQTCVYGAMLSICGVQSQDPFDCKAN